MDEVSEIKSRLNIEDVVSEYVDLKRTGRNFKGLSPFTNEKTPSFIVSPEKQIWHDFSSGKGGDIFSFIIEIEGLDFKGSLQLLARKAGVELKDYSNKNSDSNGKSIKERLFAAVEQAVSYYQVQLTKDTNSLKYLREERQFEKQTLIDFRFGYAPVGGSNLTNHLLDKGFSEIELKKSGLVSQKNGRIYDMFRDRVMIPLMDAQGRPVGFTARIFNNKIDAPKYINTPATILYDKGRQVFGLHKAKEAMRKSGFAVIVEGNLDVVMSYQSGVRQVVASAGTALTAHHLKSIQRFTGDIRVAFDDDRAGQEAAERSIPLAQSLGIEMSIISLPAGQDPDDLIKQDIKAWKQTIESPKYMIDWLIERIESSLDLKTAQGKRKFTTKIIEIIQQLKDKVEQEHYIQVIAKKTNTSKQTIIEKFAGQPIRKHRLKRFKPTVSEPTDIRDQRIREQHFLSLALNYKDIALLLKSIPMDIFSEKAQEIVEFIQQNPGKKISLDSLNSSKSKEYAKMLTLLFEEQYQHTEEDELIYQAKSVLSRLVHYYAKMKKHMLIADMQNADETKQKTLLIAVKQLDDLVVQFSK